MKKSIQVDPVLSEMHEIKDANARRFNGDLGKQFRRFRELQARSGRRIVRAKCKLSSPANS